MSQETLSLRTVEGSDCGLLFEWANEPSTREAAYSSEKISRNEHENWFYKQLNNENSYIYIAEKDDQPVGQIRFECDDEDAVVSVSIDKSFRGMGFGSQLIELGTKKVLAENNRLNLIHAWIKQENEPSVRAFRNAGYRFEEKTEHKGHPSVHYVFSSAV